MSSIVLKNERGEEVEAKAGDIVRFRKDMQRYGVIDRITPARVRVLSRDKYGNYVESNLIFHKRMEAEETSPRQPKERDQSTATNRANVPTQALEAAQQPKLEEEVAALSSDHVQRHHNAEVVAFFKEVEEKMVSYTQAAVELYLMLETAKVRFTAGPGRYPDQVAEIREEFRAEAQRRVTEFQQFVDQTAQKFKKTGNDKQNP